GGAVTRALARAALADWPGFNPAADWPAMDGFSPAGGARRQGDPLTIHDVSSETGPDTSTATPALL
ncbi:hypothetical protein HMPREF9946_03897, partial [Acetobacteraceae bacterium AT-5844]